MSVIYLAGHTLPVPAEAELVFQGIRIGSNIE